MTEFTLQLTRLERAPNVNGPCPSALAPSHDLYSGGNDGGIKIVKLPVTGANVPWHRE